MLEAQLDQASLLKRVVESMLNLVSDCNFDCADTGISLQAMDSSHIALCSLSLESEAFKSYRCDRNMTLGMNITSLNKLLKCGGNEDELTLQAEDQANTLSIVFQDQRVDKISEFNLKLMDIEQEHLSVPEADYSAEVTMPSGQFQKLVRDLTNLSDSIKIEATKDGVRFSCTGDIGDGSIHIKPYNDMEASENKDESVKMNISEPVVSNFNGQYLLNICKSAVLSNTVTLRMSPEVPVEIEYKLPKGHLKYFLAPKLDDDE